MRCFSLDERQREHESLGFVFVSVGNRFVDIIYVVVLIDDDVQKCMAQGTDTQVFHTFKLCLVADGCVVPDCYCREC